MIRSTIALSVILALSACDRTSAPPAGPSFFREQPANLLTMLHGATVVDRTGEFSLRTSAIDAIDGDPTTAWATPPGDLEQTLTIALSREASIRRIGIHFGGGSTQAGFARSLRFEASSDGMDFAPLGTVEAEAKPLTWLTIEPSTATHLRVTVLAAFEDNATVAQVPTLLADGETLSSPPVPDLRGRWRINNFEATISTDEKIVHGVTNETPPRVFRGAWDDRAIRFAWAQGSDYGVGVMTADSEGKALNAKMWHIKAHPPFAAPAWFGERMGEIVPVTDAPQIMDAFFRAEGRFPLHDLVFDGTSLVPGSGATLRMLAGLIEANPPGTFRFAAHYVSEGSEQEDLAMSKGRVEALRAELARMGVAVERAGYDAAARRDLRDLPWSEPELFLNNRVDLELVRPSGE